MKENKIPRKGNVEVITGSMFSGKSEELIRRAKRAKFGKQKVLIFKHSSDKRYDETKVASHSQNFIEAIPVSNIAEMKKITKENKDVRVVCIDEVQFFGENIVAFCEELANLGIRVIVAGLDMDFRGEPFKPMDELMARADFVSKFNAICVCCGNTASRTQRIINGEPAKYDDPIILVGASESYEPRCRDCHQVEE